jgi:hypothetical protein
MGSLEIDAYGCPDEIDGPPALSADGEHLVVAAYNGCPPNRRARYSSLLASSDSGSSVQGGLDGEPEGDRDAYAPIMSPASPLRFYAVGEEGGPSSVWTSLDGGDTWLDQAGADPATYIAVDTRITPDPILSSTVYANMKVALRSDDAGKTWTTIISPTVTPILKSFAVQTNPILPGALIGQTTDKAIAPDVRYYSDDSAQTWTTGTCPGDLRGFCPTITIGAAFGAGYSYAFTPSGIYPFVGRGPAEARLAISDRLPVPSTTITDAQAGSHPGDPIFILAGGQVYRSMDAGESWRLLTVAQGPMPNLLPPSTAKGTLLVRQTHHAVGSVFVATYKKLGLAITGYPVTEAYLEHGMLYQDFQRLRLQLGAMGAVKVAPLGTTLFTALAQERGSAGAIYRRAALPVAPVPTGTSQRYFAGTKHVLRQPLLSYWQQHGGMAVFGQPISEVFQAANGDGSGRLYAMQYFTNSRLELHPELHDPRYTVQLGLLGSESLIARGWSPAP